MTAIEREYANGLYELAKDEDILAQIHTELLEIRECLKQEPAFAKLLTSHALDRATRLKIIDDTFSGRAHQYIVCFMKLMIEKERFGSFDGSVKCFHQRYNDEFGIVEARVVTAVELTQEERSALLAKLEVISGKKVALRVRIDSSILGGLRVEMEGKRYDNTIQNKLTRLRRSMAAEY